MTEHLHPRSRALCAYELAHGRAWDPEQATIRYQRDPVVRQAVRAIEQLYTEVGVTYHKVHGGLFEQLPLPWTVQVLKRTPQDPHQGVCVWSADSDLVCILTGPTSQQLADLLVRAAVDEWQKFQQKEPVCSQPSN